MTFLKEVVGVDKVIKVLKIFYKYRHLVQKCADWDDIIPVTPCHWDDIIPVDGGWLPHWDEALDESTGIIEAVYFAPYLYGGRSPPITKLQNTQLQLSQLIHPKPHPNGASNLHPLG